MTGENNLYQLSTLFLLHIEPETGEKYILYDVKKRGAEAK